MQAVNKTACSKIGSCSAMKFVLRWKILSRLGFSEKGQGILWNSQCCDWKAQLQADAEIYERKCRKGHKNGKVWLESVGSHAQSMLPLSNRKVRLDAGWNPFKAETRNRRISPAREYIDQLYLVALTCLPCAQDVHPTTSSAHTRSGKRKHEEKLCLQASRSSILF